MNILLVEPDRALAEQYQQSLADIGETKHVVDAQSAIHAIDHALPDVIVLELLLGSHNGIEFLYELRSYSDAQDIPVVLHTYVDHTRFTSDEVLLHELGVVEHLYKPSTSLMQLNRTLQRVLKAA